MNKFVWDDSTPSNWNSSFSQRLCTIRHGIGPNRLYTPIITHSSNECGKAGACFLSLITEINEMMHGVVHSIKYFICNYLSICKIYRQNVTERMKKCVCVCECGIEWNWCGCVSITSRIHLLYMYVAITHQWKALFNDVNLIQNWIKSNDIYMHSVFFFWKVIQAYIHCEYCVNCAVGSR